MMFSNSSVGIIMTTIRKGSGRKVSYPFLYIYKKLIFKFAHPYQYIINFVPVK